MMARLTRLLRRFRTDTRGVSALEFAMLVPLMLTLYIGTVEVSLGVAADRKLAIAARTTADLVAQTKTMNPAELANVFKAAEAVMAPYSAGRLTIAITSIAVDDTGKTTVLWSRANKGAAKKTQDLSVPAAFRTSARSLVWVEAKYDYVPMKIWSFIDTVHLKSESYMSPRIAEAVQWSNS